MSTNATPEAYEYHQTSKFLSTIATPVNLWMNIAKFKMNRHFPLELRFIYSLLIDLNFPIKYLNMFFYHFHFRFDLISQSGTMNWRDEFIESGIGLKSSKSSIQLKKKLFLQ